MDATDIKLYEKCKVQVWNTFGPVKNWIKRDALYLGNKGSQEFFLTFVLAEPLISLDETLASYTSGLDRMVVYSDLSKFIIRKADCFHFRNQLGFRQTTYINGSEEYGKLESIAKEKGLIPPSS